MDERPIHDLRDLPGISAIGLAEGLPFEVERGVSPSPEALTHVTMRDGQRLNADGSSRALAQWDLPHYRERVRVERGCLPTDCFRCKGEDDHCPVVAADPTDWRACPHAM